MSEPPGGSGAAKPSRAALANVYLIVFVDLLGFGIILPSLPYFAREMGASGLGLGVVFSAYSVAQLLGSTVLGRLSDRYGRRPILLASLAGSAASMALSGLATSLLFLAVARAMAGLFGGSISAAQAYIADVTERAERARYMGLLGASIGVGFVLGPALGAGIVAMGYGFRGSAFAAAGLAALNLVSAGLRLPESRRPGAAASRHLSLADWGLLLRRANLPQTLGSVFLTTFAFVSLETTLVFVAKDRFDLDEHHFGMLLAYMGVVVIVVQGGLIGRLTKRFGVRRIAVTGSLLMGSALVLVPVSPTRGALLVALALVAAGQGMTSPTLSTLISHISSGEEHGALLGMGQSLAAAARAVGPVIAGQLYDLQKASPFVAAGGLALLAGVLISTSSAD